MDIMIIVYAVLSYLIGSIPSGLIIGKFFFNTDVRQYGSKNIGATNTYRVIGLKAALPVFLCDALKGAVGVVLLSPYGPMFMILGGILAMQYAIEHPEKMNSLVLIGTQYEMPKYLLKMQNLIFRIMPCSAFEKMGYGFRCTYCSFTNSSIDLLFGMGCYRILH